MLPHGDARLDLLDERGAGSEGIAPMRRAGSGRECAVADLEGTGAMRDGDGDDVEALGDLGCEVSESVAGARMGFVVEAQDRPAVVVVSDVSREGDDRTRSRVIDERGHVARRDGLGGDGGVPHGTRLASRLHSVIIGVLAPDRHRIRPEGSPMREILNDLLAAYDRGEPCAMATVVRTWRSAPRPAGASMIVTAGGEAIGSVSGGCVEGALYDLGQEVLADGEARFETYGVSDDDAFSVGLTCGGILDVFVERVDRDAWPELPGIVRSVEAEEPVAVAAIVAAPGSAGLGRHLVVRPDSVEGSLGTERLDETVTADARGLLASGTTGFLRYGPEGERLGDGLDVFVASMAPPPRMYIFGAIDFSAALCRVGKVLGFRVTVCDAREIFATPRRFPDADEVVVDWPHRWLSSQPVDRRTVICVLTHDPKFDVPALEVALRTDAGYVGAMGSRRTHEDRLRRLKEVGMTDEEIARLRSPIGLDLGARTPEETAISIAAEIIQERWGGSGSRLAETSGPIHPGAPR
ncbi:MAG: hypothetical protein RL134_2405 [Actinomycetota bacterium]